MIESQSPPQPSASEIVSRKVEFLRTYDGKYSADIFEVASSLFPSFQDRFRGVGFALGSNPGFSYKGRGDITESLIEIGPLDEEAVSQYLPKRINKRYEIPEELVVNEQVGPTIVRYIAFAHELGHLVQDNNQEMLHFFGDTLPNKEGNDDKLDLQNVEEYLKYVNSPREMNADYIARCILANSELGNVLGIDLPEQEPKDWLDWAVEKSLQPSDF